MKLHRPLVLILAVLLVVPAVAQQKRPFTFEDMMALKRVGEPAVSPDGKWIVFSAVTVNLAENTRRPHLWIVPIAGGEARRLTSGNATEDRPRFSPDGRSLLFITSRDAGSQVFVAPFDSATAGLGEARQVSAISTEASGALWAPNGRGILFVSEVYPDCPDDACNKQRDAQREKSKVKATLFTRLFFRHWATYALGKRSHLFLVPAEGGVARDLTPGDHDVPPFSLGGQDMYAFSPDGQEVAFTSNIDESEASSTNNEVFTLSLAAGSKPAKISASPGSDSVPLYSPDGRYIAYRMQERGGYESDRFQIVLFDRKAKTRKNLTANFDRQAGTMQWAPDSSRIYFVAEDRGESPIYVVNVNGGPVREILRGHNDDLAITADGKTLLFTRMSAQAPNEIYRLDLSTVKLADPRTGSSARPGRRTSSIPQQFPVKDAAQQVTQMNDAVLAQVHTSPLEPFWFTGADKDPVQGFLVTPPNFDRSKKYPMKFLIHGGPQGAFGDSWTYRWNAQLFAADGYVVAMINFHGSTGYGQAFTDSIRNNWGGRPYTDLMQGLDVMVRKYPFVDGNRVCAMGASYGGYMVNWILGHTNRFQCAVSHDGMFNTESAYGSTEELWFPEWEFTGTPWQKREVYRQWSPHNYATAFKTPTLVIHGQLDYRLDVSEGFQLFTTLQRLKVPSKMLYFPDEGHWVLKPQNSQLWYKTVNQWVDSHLKK